eukprot:snap_masked-scaffold_148-processed-gene-0.1-mRNA-1 protein AED:1.00 eAED:1.00 QI:0/-1/0/0/-1/1/1/0/145
MDKDNIIYKSTTRSPQFLNRLLELMTQKKEDLLLHVMSLNTCGFSRREVSALIGYISKTPPLDIFVVQEVSWSGVERLKVPNNAVSQEGLGKWLFSKANSRSCGVVIFLSKRHITMINFRCEVTDMFVRLKITPTGKKTLLFVNF